MSYLIQILNFLIQNYYADKNLIIDKIWMKV